MKEYIIPNTKYIHLDGESLLAGSQEGILPIGGGGSDDDFDFRGTNRQNTPWTYMEDDK